MNRSFVVLLAACSLSIAACTKEETSVGRQETFKAWGKDFVIKPVSEASEETQKLSKAVAQVRYAHGGSGTGFFISPDGLFLTNEHVISRKVCSETRCGGVQIVRDLSPGGDIQVFSKFTILAQSEELDFTLAKVDLPPGTSVPYLKLEPNILSETSLPEKQYAVIGHPAGSALRVTEVNLQAFNGDHIRLAGPVFWGNSGSPLLDLKTGRVIGLVANVEFGPNSMNKEGNMTVTPQAVRINVVMQTLRAVYPSAYADPYTLKVSDFSPEKRTSTEKILKALAPASRESFDSHEEMTTETFIGQYLGTEREEAGLQKLMSSLDKKVRTFDAYWGALHSLVAASRRADKSLKLTPLQISSFKSNLSGDDSSETSQTRLEAQNLFRSHVGDIPESECLRQVDADSNPYLASSVCLSTTYGSARDVMDFLNAYRDSLLDRGHARYQVFLRLIYFTISSRINAGPLRSGDVPKALELLAVVAKEADNVGLAFNAESVHALLQRDPSLVGKGSFRSAF